MALLQILVHIKSFRIHHRFLEIKDKMKAKPVHDLVINRWYRNGHLIWQFHCGVFLHKVRRFFAPNWQFTVAFASSSPYIGGAGKSRGVSGIPHHQCQRQKVQSLDAIVTSVQKFENHAVFAADCSMSRFSNFATSLSSAFADSRQFRGNLCQYYRII